MKKNVSPGQGLGRGQGRAPGFKNPNAGRPLGGAKGRAKKAASFCLDAELLAEIRAHSAASGISQAVLLDSALRSFLKL